MEKQVLALAILVILTGLPLLVLASALLSPDQKTTITLEGFVEKTTDTGKVTFIDLNLVEPLTLVSFNNVNLSKNSFIKIEGHLQEYKGKLEFIVDGFK